jgi:uncharacterized protein with HEPN domain
MYKEDEIIRLKSIQQKIKDIYKIIDRHKSITKSLDDFEGQPAILMLIVAISEQFTKLVKVNSNILKNFDELDIKGITRVRNYIAHDYDGINLPIIEDDLRYNMPRIKEIIDQILKEE